MKDYAQLLEEAEWDGWSDYQSEGLYLPTSKLTVRANEYVERIAAETLYSRVQYAQLAANYIRGYQAAERSEKYAPAQ